VQAVY